VYGRSCGIIAAGFGTSFGVLADVAGVDPQQ
jgi:hypothetical protein